jgi:hypothetical protein
VEVARRKLAKTLSFDDFLSTSASSHAGYLEHVVVIPLDVV